MSRPDLKGLLERAEDERSIGPGQSFLREGKHSGEVFIVERGMGLRHKQLPDGQRQVIGFMMPGDLVGLQSGLNGAMSHTAEATTPMRLLAIPKGQVERVFAGDPVLAKSIAIAAVEEERALGEALTTVGQREAIARVAWLLCKLHERMTSAGITDGRLLPLPFRQQDIADALGLSLVHTNKTLAKLKRDGLAVWSGKRVEIADFDALSALLEKGRERAA